MGRFLSFCLLATLLLPVGAALGAQDDPAPAPTADEAAAAELDRLDEAYTEARVAYARAAADQRARRAEDPSAELPVLVNPGAEFLRRYREAARRFAGTATSTSFLIEAFGICYRTDEVAATEILDELLDGHMRSEKLPSIASKLTIGTFYLGQDRVRTAMTRIIDESPHDTVKAAYLYARSSLVVRARSSTPEERAAAVDDLDRAMELGAGTAYVERARAAKFELLNLQIGMPAPDIEGEDLNGMKFKLSDYRGKVVVLDFWGDW